MPEQESLNAFIAYKAKLDGSRVPVQLVAAPSKAQALKMTAALGLMELVAVEDADASDVVKLTLPALVMMQQQMLNALAVIAQDAGQRITEREKGRLGLVRGN